MLRENGIDRSHMQVTYLQKYRRVPVNNYVSQELKESIEE